MNGAAHPLQKTTLEVASSRQRWCGSHHRCLESSPEKRGTKDCSTHATKVDVLPLASFRFISSRAYQAKSFTHHARGCGPGTGMPGRQAGKQRWGAPWLMAGRLALCVRGMQFSLLGSLCPPTSSSRVYIASRETLPSPIPTTATSASKDIIYLDTPTVRSVHVRQAMGHRLGLQPLTNSGRHTLLTTHSRVRVCVFVYVRKCVRVPVCACRKPFKRRNLCAKVPRLLSRPLLGTVDRNVCNGDLMPSRRYCRSRWGGGLPIACASQIQIMRTT